MVISSPPQSSLSSLWYCRIHGLERGPITWDMLQHLAQNGDLKPSDLVRRADTERWVVASQARCAEPVETPRPPQRENVITERLAAVLAADQATSHAPARSFKRVEEPDATPAEAESQLRPASVDGNASVAADALLEEPIDEQIKAEDEPESIAATDTQPELKVGSTASQAVVAAVLTPAVAEPRKLPAVAIAHAVRNKRPSNPAGLALLALGLALIGLFKLALPLGMLALYLAGKSAADLRHRPTGAGLAVAAGALIVGMVDVGVSLYTIVNRL